MKKVLLTTTMALAGAAALHAADYDYPYLTLQTADGTKQSVAVGSLTLTFANGQLVATNDEGSYNFSLVDLTKMYFTENTSAIVTMHETLPTESTVEVYAIGGRLVGRYSSESEARQRLDKGIYIFKCNNRTYKTTVK